MNSTLKVRVTITIDPDVLKKSREVARLDHRKLSNLVEVLLDKAAAGLRGDEPRAQAKEEQCTH